ncbi:hypothetical protein OCU04_002829 [Sclerotinia nivalis]|uniref:Uncharacterized protein n=1 Tax=Sclerotinia nivalis TaxID=352851 RepID=A0A9X0AUG1_9HELO|nr:hypothetical protein OCU04_002829 [Sclerotinia nivalis]
MNTTMAPMREQSEQYMNQLVQRNVMLNGLILVKKDGNDNDNGDGYVSDNGNRDGNDNNNGDGSDNDNGNRYGNSNDNGNRDSSSIPMVTRTAWTQITDTAWTTQTATAWTTQTTITTSSSVMTVVVVATPSSTSTSESSPSTSISITSAMPSLPTGSFAAFSMPSSGQPGRKGLCSISNGAPCDFATATTSTFSAFEAISASAAPTAFEDDASSLSSEIPSQSHSESDHNDSDGDLSPLAEKLLISAGSIGIFVILGAIICLVIRMKKINRLARGEISEEEARWYGWRRNRDGPGRPPGYVSGKLSRNGYPIDEKYAEREMAGFNTPDNKVSLGRPGSATVNLRELRTDLQRQNSTRSNQSGSGMSPSPVAGPGQSYGPPSNTDFYYSQIGTIRSQQSGLSGQSSNAYDPSRKEANHISYLSSISSGFGDSLVMPDDSAPPQNPVSRFSWTTASQGAPQNRDTIYTTTSEETAPRFRTVRSWVAQQTGRLERKQSNMEVPAMPEIPISYTHRSQVPDPLFAEAHRRKASENPAFRHHPGDEIEFGRGSRVPSSILDKSIGF